MNSLTRLFGGETDPVKKFTGKIKKRDVIIRNNGEFAIIVRNETYENIIKSKYGNYINK